MSDGKLIVYFEDPFWVGVFERIENGKLTVSKVTFGAEPTEAQLYEFISNHSDSLEFSAGIATEIREKADTPKRRARNARKDTAGNRIGTKSQQALKLQRDMQNAERTKENKIRREEEADRKFELKQEKKKQKHKGH